MASERPQRDKIYRGPMTQSDAWDTFALRQDDIIISTPPKCGTTWMQSITVTLIFGQPEIDIGVSNISLWLDCGFRDRDDIAARLNAQTHRRCIKSHTPLDGISYSPEATYIAVYRHPMDVHFSMRTHVENLAVELNQSQFPDNIGEGFRMFVDNSATQSGTDDLTVASIVQHYMSFRKWEHLPNVHLFHYADMTRDLAGQMDRLARIYDIEHDTELMAQLVEAATFRSMKNNAINNKRERSVFKNPAEFFANATSNKWEKFLGEADVAAYGARVADMLPKADRDWLEWGNVQ